MRIWCDTFELRSAGADVHPLLTFSTAHQETGHRLSGQKRIRLRYLTHKYTILNFTSGSFRLTDPTNANSERYKNPI